jgi:hypothetical protein
MISTRGVPDFAVGNWARCLSINPWTCHAKYGVRIKSDARAVAERYLEIPMRASLFSTSAQASTGASTAAANKGMTNHAELKYRKPHP